MTSLLAQDYQFTPNMDNYDYYDLNFADDILGASTNLTSGATVNDLMPYPAFVDDPEETLVIKYIDHYLTTQGLLNLANVVATQDLELFEVGYAYFSMDETDESTEAFRDELKEIIDRVQMYVQPNLQDTTNNAANAIHGNTRKLLEFGSARTFPLNPAMKYHFTAVSTGIDVFLSPEHLMYRPFFRIGRNPLGHLGRIITLIQQNLTA